MTKHSYDDATTAADLSSLIEQHSCFFDKLIELIPARYYISKTPNENTWTSGLSKEKKALMKKISRENVKKARRKRLDPEKSSKSTLDMLVQNLAIEDGRQEDDSVVNPSVYDVESEHRAVTYEELRERLHRKIEDLRAGRNEFGLDKSKSKKNGGKYLNKKKRKTHDYEEKEWVQNENDNEELEKNVAAATKELEFGNLKLEDDHGKAKRRKLSKAKMLEKAKKLEEAKQDPVKGKVVLEKHSWEAATSRAAGIKVHDNPKLLKQSIKKEKKRHEKSVEKWKERTEAQHNAKLEKQQVRAQHVADRIEQKKMHRMEKREKKLMRAGFEGRKEGYINEG